MLGRAAGRERALRLHLAGELPDASGKDNSVIHSPLQKNAHRRHVSIPALRLRRSRLEVQEFVPQGSDPPAGPALWTQVCVGPCLVAMQ